MVLNGRSVVLRREQTVKVSYKDQFRKKVDTSTKERLISFSLTKLNTVDVRFNFYTYFYSTDPTKYTYTNTF